MNSLGFALEKLDDDQRTAALSDGRSTICLAGPGSGKTTTIACRVAWLVSRGCSIYDILCVTFSLAAAEEMRKRIQELTGINERQMTASVSTFHAQALRMINSERSRLDFQLAPDPVAHPSLVSRIIRSVVPKGEDWRYAHRFISMARRSLLTPEEAASQANCEEEMCLAKWYHDYHVSLLMNSGMIDFDSMVYMAVHQLRSNPESNASWTSRYEHVIVDEAHDTSPDQAALAKLLCTTGKSFFVGDTSQRIYTFRGASNDLLVDESSSDKRFLGVNYRSGAEIIKAFIPFAETDELSQRLVSSMRPADEDKKGQVHVRMFLNEDDECSAISSNIADSILSGREPRQHAVLSRTRSFLAAYADALSEYSIPYRWLGKNFWKSGEVQDALAFMRLALDPKDMDSFCKVICSGAQVTKFLGPKFAGSVVRTCRATGKNPLDVDEPQDKDSFPARMIITWHEARDVLRDLISGANQMTPAQYLTAVRIDAGLSPEEDYDPDDFRGDNVAQLVQRASKFQDIKAFLAHADSMARNQLSNKNGVALTTIHGAKGLEWGRVYVVAMCENIFPHQRASDLGEERRIAYVALSRARDSLIVSCHGKPSLFFREIQQQKAKVQES